MDHECHGCGRRFGLASGQVIRRGGHYVCVTCYSPGTDGLSDEARELRRQRLSGAVVPAAPSVDWQGRRRAARSPVAAASRQGQPAKPTGQSLGEAPRIDVVGEPILDDDDESF